MVLSPTALSVGNFYQSRAPAWAPNTLHVGSSTSQTLRREQPDERAHILATSANFLKRFQSPAAIGAILAFTVLAEPDERRRFSIVADPQSSEASIYREDPHGAACFHLFQHTDDLLIAVASLLIIAGAVYRQQVIQTSGHISNGAKGRKDDRSLV
jgi:hypothetical protein